MGRRMRTVGRRSSDFYSLLLFALVEMSAAQTHSLSFLCRPGKPGVYARVSTGYDWIWNLVCTQSKRPPESCNKKRKKGNKKNRKRRNNKRLLRKGDNKEVVLLSDEKTASSSSSSFSLPACQDKSDDLFDIRDEHVDKDCDWLTSSEGSQAGGTEKLCDWMHVSYRCPKTCGMC